jgi:hypothetical protein
MRNKLRYTTTSRITRPASAVIGQATRPGPAISEQALPRSGFLYAIMEISPVDTADRHFRDAAV